MLNENKMNEFGRLNLSLFLEKQVEGIRYLLC